MPQVKINQAFTATAIQMVGKNLGTNGKMRQSINQETADPTPDLVISIRGRMSDVMRAGYFKPFAPLQELIGK